MPSVTLNVPFSQINIKRSIKNEILKSVWRMSCPHWSWRLGSHGMVSLCLESSLSLGSIPGSVSLSSSRNIDFPWPPASFMIQIQVYCISKLPRPRNSTTTLLPHLSMSTYCWVQTGQSTCLPVVAIALGGPCHLPSNCFHRHYAFCPYTSSSGPFMSWSLSLTSSYTLATSLRLGSFVSNFLSNNSSDNTPVLGKAYSERQLDISWLPLSNSFPPAVSSAFF